MLARGYSALDAVEIAIRLVEDDPTCNSVGTGGLPNAQGVLELDASIMDGATMNAGGITCLTMTKNPISVARKVMELTPHVLLAGQGATDFARRCGFPEYDPMTAESRTTWKKLRDRVFSAANDETALRSYLELTRDEGNAAIFKLTQALRSLLSNWHGTVGVLAADRSRKTAAGTSTSGWALRFPGRVSDSSIIGAGTYANKRAAASATGIGETVIKYCLTKEVCDLVQEGNSPTEACEAALANILANERCDHLVAVFCVDADYNVGGASTKEGFQFEYLASSDSKPVIVTPKPIR